MVLELDIDLCIHGFICGVDLIDEIFCKHIGSNSTGWFINETDSTCRILLNEISITSLVFLKEKDFEICDFIVLNPPSRTASVINWVPEVKIS